MIYVIFRKPTAFSEDKSWKATIVGAIFSVSALAYIFSANENGVATAYIITQLNVVISTLGGMYILHENKTPKEKINDYRIIADRSRKHGHGLYLRIKMVKFHLLKNICLNQTVSTYKKIALEFPTSLEFLALFNCLRYKGNICLDQ